jgi:Transcription initiation factor IID, 18kD subunit
MPTGMIYEGVPPQQRKLQKFEPPPPPDLSAGLPLMMYGHGDSNMPLSESVDLVNSLLTQHIRELTLRCVLLSLHELCLDVFFVIMEQACAKANL